MNREGLVENLEMLRRKGRSIRHQRAQEDRKKPHAHDEKLHDVGAHDARMHARRRVEHDEGRPHGKRLRASDVCSRREERPRGKELCGEDRAPGNQDRHRDETRCTGSEPLPHELGQREAAAPSDPVCKHCRQNDEARLAREVPFSVKTAFHQSVGREP